MMMLEDLTSFDVAKTFSNGPSPASIDALKQAFTVKPVGAMETAGATGAVAGTYTRPLLSST